MKKRILSLLLCIVMCLSLMPMSAFAEESFEFRNLPTTGVTNITVPAGNYYTGVAAKDAFILYWGENIKTDGDFLLIDYLDTDSNGYHSWMITIKNDVISAEDGGYAADLCTILDTINNPFYASWGRWINGTFATDSCTVTFDTKGGSAIDDVTFTDATFGELPTPEREGYVFDGWYAQDYQEQKYEEFFYDGYYAYADILRLSNLPQAVSSTQGFADGIIIDFDVVFTGTVPTNLDVNDCSVSGDSYSIENNEISGSITFDDMQNDSSLDGNWRTFIDIETNFTKEDLDPSVGYAIKYFRVFRSSNQKVTAETAVPSEQNITLYAGWSKNVTCGIEADADALTFGSVTEGYAPVDEKTVNISNIGDLPTGAITIALSGANADAFDISKDSIDNIAVGENDTFTIAPKADLTKGSYTATLTICDSNGNGIELNVTFSVKAKSSGSSAPTAYTTTVADSDHGKVTVSPESARAGEAVTIDVTPDKGYTLETITVTDKNGKEVELTADKVGEIYSFKMPSGEVTVEASFMEDNTMLNYFVDVTADDYFYDAVLWAAENDITSGVDAVHFDPDAGCTRAQVVTFLWRAAGCPEVAVGDTFTDVAKSSYYEKAVAWAMAEGITKGTSETEFSPDATCNRGQIGTFLWRAAGSPAMLNMTAAGPAVSNNPFWDVSSMDYFYQAVLWAVDNGITNGTTATTFSPNAECTRAQIVTFLYRNMGK